ncbi:MAG: 8-oxo-dGTP pyrophosphatase MutT (NUDIX family) [Paracoccaceae bacterium]|jgi:8-oxo-dGTP pyrophosphatase MutT (NUDIX family)
MENLNTIDNVRRMLARGAAEKSSDFDLNADRSSPFPNASALRQAAVLVPLIERSGGLNVILTKRASHLKHHPGQIAFPGGKVEDFDKNEIATALREADEETGLSPDNVDVLGRMPFHETVTHFQIAPVVGQVKMPFSPRPEPGEVAEVFEVPLAHLTDLNNYLVEGRHWGGSMRHYYVVPYGPYYIWGATARILRGFAERLST